MTKENRPHGEILQALGNRMKEVRIALKMQQETLASELTVTRTTLSRMENGKIGPSFDVLLALFQKFDINIHYLLDGKEEMFRANDNEVQVGGNNQPMSKEDTEFFRYYFLSTIVRLETLAKFSMLLTKEGPLIEHEIERKKVKAEAKAKG